ncbi:MAG: hypothetical protein H0X24_07865 [Ktedonobacterales bacterium]|nr:hypothetical protein [Ktedonobacterales bacterium]
MELLAILAAALDRLINEHAINDPAILLAPLQHARFLAVNRLIITGRVAQVAPNMTTRRQLPTALLLFIVLPFLGEFVARHADRLLVQTLYHNEQSRGIISDSGFLHVLSEYFRKTLDHLAEIWFIVGGITEPEEKSLCHKSRDWEGPSFVPAIRRLFMHGMPSTLE